MSGTATSMPAYQFPTAVSWGYPHLEVFALQKDVYPVWKYKGSSADEDWSPGRQSFTLLNGQIAPYQPSMAAIARNGSAVDIFVVGFDSALFHKYHDNPVEWGPDILTWEFCRGLLVGPPTVVSNTTDRMDIYAIGPDYGIYQTWWDSDGWHKWIGLQPNPSNTWTKDAPTVVPFLVNGYHIFLVNATDRALYYMFWNGSASEWIEVGGYLTSRPVAVSRPDGRLDLFARGGDAGLWQISFNQDASSLVWSNWTSISGDTKVLSEPEAVTWGPENIEVFAWGENNTLLHKRYDDNDESWTPNVGFEIIGEDLAGPPKAVCDRSESVHVFAYLRNGQLGHKSWDSDADAWSPPQDFELLGMVR